MVSTLISLRSLRTQALEETLGNVAYGLVAPRSIISQVPQMGQTTLQFVQQFRMTSREKPYGAEKKVLNRHLTATSLHNLRGVGLVLQAAHDTPKPLLTYFSYTSLYRVVASTRQALLERNVSFFA